MRQNNFYMEFNTELQQIEFIHVWEKESGETGMSAHAMKDPIDFTKLQDLLKWMNGALDSVH